MKSPKFYKYLKHRVLFSAMGIIEQEFEERPNFEEL